MDPIASRNVKPIRGPRFSRNPASWDPLDTIVADQVACPDLVLTDGQGVFAFHNQLPQASISMVVECQEVTILRDTSFSLALGDAVALELPDNVNTFSTLHEQGHWNYKWHWKTVRITCLVLLVYIDTRLA